MSKKKSIRDGYFQEINARMARNVRTRDAIKVACEIMGLTYGPSECRPHEADEFIAAQNDATRLVPVQYVQTRNPAILEARA